MTEYFKRDPAGMPQEIINLIARRFLDKMERNNGHATSWNLSQLGAGHSGDPVDGGGDTNREVHNLTAETMGVVPGARDLWCSHVLHLIQERSLAEAGLELARLVDYALKTQHGDHFNREVRDCVHAFWNRCAREDSDR